MHTNKKDDESGMVLKKTRKTKKNESSSFQEADDSFVCLPSMKRMLDDCLEGIPGDIPRDKVIRANNIIENFQLSWVEKVQNITNTEMEHCVAELKKLFGSMLTEKSTCRQDNFYSKHVLSKVGMKEKDGQKIVVDIESFPITEYEFVNIFKPNGWMSNWVAHILTSCWNTEWDNEKVITDQVAVVSIN